MPNELLRKQKEIIAEFDALPDVDAKYDHLFRLAEAMPEMDPGFKTDANLVRDCQSTLWCRLDCRDGGVRLAADSDSLVMKGITALLRRMVDGCRPEQVEHLNLDVIDHLHIWKLAAERNSSLTALLSHIKAQARQLPCATASEKIGNTPCQN